MDELHPYRHHHVRDPVQLGITLPSEPVHVWNYLPLGCRIEFLESTCKAAGFEIDCKEEDKTEWRAAIAGQERTISFNYVVSLSTSTVRREIYDYLNVVAKKEHKKLVDAALIHSAKTWVRHPRERTGHLTPEEYLRKLVDSHFTLCPIGHNPEQYRIYEAAYVGSIPVVFLKNDHECKLSLQPFIVSGAPFIYASDIEDALVQMEQYLQLSQSEKAERQRALMRWHDTFMMSSANSLMREVIEYGRREMSITLQNVQ